MGAPLGRSPRAQLETEGYISVKMVPKKIIKQFWKCVYVGFKGTIQYDIQNKIESICHNNLFVVES